jgi:hypothetical protein
MMKTWYEVRRELNVTYEECYTDPTLLVGLKSGSCVCSNTMPLGLSHPILIPACVCSNTMPLGLSHPILIPACVCSNTIPLEWSCATQ